MWPSVGCTAIPALGIAQAAINEFAELATKKTPTYTTTMLKDRPIVQLRFATAVAKVESARAYLHEAFDAAWQGALEGRSLDLAGRARLLLASSHAPIAAAEAVDLIHSLAGTAGIRNDQAFQRHFRDVHVITQHAFVSESRMEAVGQVRFGLDPNWPFLHF
jgi:alkylation response protein AidB-like acyl-CoA dehydrogenase